MLQEKKQEDFMKLIVQQQELQSKQIQDFQALMFTVLNKFGPKLLSFCLRCGHH